MQELKLNLNEEKNEMCISFKLEKDEKKIEIFSEITRLYDCGEFQKNLLDAFYFYLNNHGFSEFEIANNKNTYHIILTMDKIIVVSDKYDENYSFVSSTINRFSDYDCWQFIKDIILDFEKEKEKWNKYIELCILNTEDRRKMKNKIEKKIKKIKKLLGTFPIYQIS